MTTLTVEDRTRLADVQRERKRKFAIFNRYLAWVTTVSLIISMIYTYRKQIGIDLPSWIGMVFTLLYIFPLFIHAFASFYFFGLPRFRNHIRVVHIYIGYAVFISMMIYLSVGSKEPLHMITYGINLAFIVAHVVLSTRFMLKRISRQKQDPMLDYAVSKKFTTN